ncbi:MAG: hypothetical protein J6M15_06265 [Prevotella sp.]|nr:hypothetical protein [Prevotella sp.]
MSEINFSWKDVPSGWALCFNQSCPLHEHCLRYQAGVLAPPDLTVTRCVTPRVLTGERCKVYASMEPVKMARGFSTIYQNVLKRDYTSLRKFMTSLLSGKRYYYEYKRGERSLSPEQQSDIRQLFGSFGYKDSVHFDSYEETLHFPWV